MASVTVFPTQLRSAGTYLSATAPYNGTGTYCEFQIVSTTWATDNPAISVRIEAYQSFDSGATWQFKTAGTPVPGGMNKDGTPPSGGFGLVDGLGPRLVQAKLILGGTLTMGLKATIT